MNTYGHTKCPSCGERNNMYRPADVCIEMPSWNNVECWNCKYEYKHFDKSVLPTKSEI